METARHFKEIALGLRRANGDVYMPSSVCEVVEVQNGDQVVVIRDNV